jgi:hypothetical protein
MKFTINPHNWANIVWKQKIQKKISLSILISIEKSRIRTWILILNQTRHGSEHCLGVGVIMFFSMQQTITQPSTLTSPPQEKEKNAPYYPLLPNIAL